MNISRQLNTTAASMFKRQRPGRVKYACCYKLVLLQLTTERSIEHFSFLFVRWTANFEEKWKYTVNNCLFIL